MPGFDGTGPRGQGPLTGRGEGYCSEKIPDSAWAPHGYAGLEGTPVRRDASFNPLAFGARFAHWLFPSLRSVRVFKRSGGAGRRRGRRSGRL